MSILSRFRGVAVAALLLPLIATADVRASSAAVDTTFGAAGETVVRLNGGWAGGSGDAVRTSDDRIVVAGIEDGYGLVVARFTASGAPDPTFDTDGIVTAAIPSIDPSTRATGVTTAPDGSIFVAVAMPGGTAGIWKLTATGVPATGFGVAGLKTLEGGASVQPGGIRLSPAGDRVYVSAGHFNDIEVHALDPSTGANDDTFGGGDGIAVLSASFNVGVEDIVVRPLDGKIYAAGAVFSLLTGSGSSMAVARFTAAGLPDTSFSGDGLVEPFLGSSAQVSNAHDLFALADGTTYAVGSGDDGASLAITRLTEAGALDTAFAGGLLTDYQPGSYGRWDGVNVQGDGSVVVSGGRFEAGASAATTRRYTATGALDTAFADAGSLRRTETSAAVALVTQTSGSGRYVSVAFEQDSSTSAYKSQLVLTGIRPSLPSVPAPTPTPTPTPAQPGTPSNPSAPAAPAAPAEKPVGEGCTRSLVVGPLEVTGECLKREGMIWTTSAAATVGGLKFVPNGASSKLIIDPLNLRIAASGGAKIIFEASVYGRTLGPVKFYEGSFDWTFQYKPDLSGLARLVMPQPGTGGKSVSQNTLKGLPGLGSVGSLPRLPDLGMPDFSKLQAPDVAKLAGRIPSLRTPNVQIPLSLLDIPSLPELRFELPRAAGSMLGFPVQGDITLKMAEREGVRGVDTTVNLALPAAFGGITGASKVFVGVNGRVIVDALGVNAAEVTLPGLIRVAPVRLSYDGPTDTWDGETRVYLGFKTGDTGLGGRWVVQGGRLKRVGISAGGIPLGGVGTLNDLVADLTLDPTRVFGTVSMGFGPKVPVLNTQAVVANGTFDFNGDFAKLTGAVSVANIPLASASAEYWWNGYFKAGGQISYFVDSKKEYGFQGKISGEATKSGFNAEGSVTFKAKGKSIAGQGIVSSVGVAGCAQVNGILWTNIKLGAGYKWGAKYIDWLGGSCDFGPYRAKLRKAQVGGAFTQLVGKDQRAVAFKVLGTSGAPQFTLTGPGGETVTAPADGETVIDERFIVVQQPEENATYVAVAKPKAGAWTFTPAAGSEIREILGADALPKPKVEGRIQGGKLRYELDSIPGQSVRFLERGTGVAVELGTAKGRSGTLRLQPEAGKGGKREIVAIVDQDGLPRASIVVARYSAPSNALAAPKVSVKRTGKGVAKVRWTRVAGATGYQAIIRLNGRVEQRTVEAKTRSVEIPGVLVSSGVSATVRALGGPTRIGRPGTGTVKKPAARKRSGKRRK